MEPDDTARFRAFLGDETAQPDCIGRFEIRRELGRGGTSVVYEARDPRLDRLVALKVLRVGGDERLLREAASAARLRHPHIVTIYEVGDRFIAMELVEGRTLAAALPDLLLRDRVLVLEVIARAVGFAHANGIVHRDIKPSNVLVRADGSPVLTDFGLAKPLGDAELTRSQAVLGTPHYMAPEQVRGRTKEIGPPADVWALGVMLHEALANERPFLGEDAWDLSRSVLFAQPRPLPGDLGAIAGKALEKDSADRYPDGDALARDLRRWLDGKPVSVARHGRLARVWWLARRSRPLVALLALASLAALVAGAFVANRRTNEQRLERLRAEARTQVAAVLELERAGAHERAAALAEPLETLAREIRAGTSDAAEIDFMVGRVRRALGDRDGALALQERALGRLQLVPALFEKALLLTMRHWDARQGEALASIDALRAAWDALGRAMATADGEADGLDRAQRAFALGMSAFVDGDLANARLHIKRALEQDPLLDGAWRALEVVTRAEWQPKLALDQRRSDGAQARASAAIAASPRRASLYLDRARVLVDRARVMRRRGLDPRVVLDEALADVARARRLAPGELAPLLVEAQLRHARAETDALWGRSGEGDFAAALRVSTAAVAKAPRDPETWMARALLRLAHAELLGRRGDPPGDELRSADRDLTRALAVRPRHASSLRARSRVRAALGFVIGPSGETSAHWFDLAEADARLADAVAPERLFETALRSAIWRKRGVAESRRGDDPTRSFAEAARHLDRALARDQTYDGQWFHRAKLEQERAAHYERTGQDVLARKAFAAAAAAYLQAHSCNPHLAAMSGTSMRQVLLKASGMRDLGPTIF